MKKGQSTIIYTRDGYKEGSAKLMKKIGAFVRGNTKIEIWWVKFINTQKAVIRQTEERFKEVVL